jgi:hypothetical protein
MITSVAGSPVYPDSERAKQKHSKTVKEIHPVPVKQKYPIPNQTNTNAKMWQQCAGAATLLCRRLSINFCLFG